MDTPVLAALSPEQLRCLRVLCEFPSVEHAARRLHCAKASLLAQIRSMGVLLGQDAVVVTGDRIVVRDTLLRCLRAPKVTPGTPPSSVR